MKTQLKGRQQRCETEEVSVVRLTEGVAMATAAHRDDVVEADTESWWVQSQPHQTDCLAF